MIYEFIDIIEVCYYIVLFLLIIFKLIWWIIFFLKDWNIFVFKKNYDFENLEEVYLFWSWCLSCV